MGQGPHTSAAVRQALISQANEATALYRLTDRLYRASSLDDVYEAALDAIVETLDCNRASILLFDEAGVMRFVAARGLSKNYRMALEGHSPWKLGQRDPQPIFVSDIDHTNEPDWVKAEVKKEGIRGLAFIPLVARGAVIGKFMTYYQVPHAFADHEVDLAVTIARQVGFSLERARSEQARQFAEEDLRESEERFRLMSEYAPVMIWMSDSEGRCLHLNRMLRDFWGVDEKGLAEFNWEETMHPDDALEIGKRMMEALVNRSGVTIKGRYRTAYGGYRVLQTDARPRISKNGEFLGMIGVNVDITAREQVESALRESEERFRLAVEAAPSGMLMTNADGQIVMMNAHAEQLFGYSRGELVGQKIEFLVPERFRRSHPEYRESYCARPSARPMGAGRDLFALRKDGTEVAVEIGLSPIVTSEGAMVLAAIVDISARKQAEAQRELLLAELNHRVKNTLAVVQGIANQTFKDTDTAPETRKSFDGRLLALAGAHNLLTEANWENASLEELAANALQARDANKERVSLSGPRVLLPPRQALDIAMVLHELFTNAVKYGALSNDAGRIEIEWTQSDEAEPRLELIWREHGGPPVSAPDRRGFGSLLLEQTLGRGEVRTEFRPEGLVCSITARLR
jgi:PAS domain S-box-containing protein